MHVPHATVDDPVLPGPEPILPGPDPIPPTPDPNPGPDAPWPAPPDPAPQPEPDDPGLAAIVARSDVVVELHGEVARVSGVVEGAAERTRILDEVASLESITRVESTLRPPAA